MFKMSNPSSGGDAPTPKKNVTFEIPEDIKEMYANDPELESYVLEHIEEEKLEKMRNSLKLKSKKNTYAAETEKKK